jgi:hypothetical protein
MIHMQRVMVRYRLHPDRVAENEALVRAVYEELREVAPPGLRYATFRQHDGVSFVHMATLEDDEAEFPLSSLPAFRRFRADLEERCVEGPDRAELHAVGSFEAPGG